MRETLIGKAFGLIGPLRTPDTIKSLADKQAAANGVPPGPQFTGLAQATLREALARGLAHPFLFRHKTEIGVPGGRQRFHEIIKQGKGGIIVDAHYGKIDPTWAFNDTTEKLGIRNIRAVFPIRWDHAPDVLLKAGGLIGATLVRVVTPAAWENAQKQGNPHGLKEGDGFMEYRKEAKKVINEGGIAIIANNPERQKELTIDTTNSLGLLVYEMVTRGNGEFGIHFYSSRIPKTKDYGSRKGYNPLKRHVAVHGATHTGNEIWKMAQDMIPKHITDKKARRDATLRNVSIIVFNEFKKTADLNYLSSEVKAETVL